MDGCKHVDKQWKSKAMQCIIALQAWARGNSTRQQHGRSLIATLEEGQRFQGAWEHTLARAKTLQRSSLLTWTGLKQLSSDLNSSHDVADSDLFETIEKLDEAGKVTLLDCEEANEPSIHATSDKFEQVESEESAFDAAQQNASSELLELRFDHILMTKEVVKWLRVGDTKYRAFFVRRMQQLTSGDRSRILAKRLTGSKTTIYLEQKSGFRILWTENDGATLLIWYVAKHKSVSRLMKLIDDAEDRIRRQLTPGDLLLGESKVSDAGPRQHQLIMLDPRGHTSLKLYNVPSTELDNQLDCT